MGSQPCWYHNNSILRTMTHRELTPAHLSAGYTTLPVDDHITNSEHTGPMYSPNNERNTEYFEHKERYDDYPSM